MAVEGNLSLAWAALGAAVAHASRGSLATARRFARGALASAPESAPLAVAVSDVLFVTRDYHASLEALAQAARHGAGTQAYGSIAERANRLGWFAEAIAALHAAAALEPANARWPAQRLTFHMRSSDYEGAVLYGRAALALEPRSPSLWLEVAAAHAGLGQLEDTLACAGRALALAPASLPHRLEAARLQIVACDLDAAEETLRGSIALDPEDGRARARLAEIALWRGDHGAAAELAGGARAVGTAQRTLAVIALYEGRRDEARAGLERVAAADPDDAEAHAWLAEIAILRGDEDEAHAALNRAVAAAGGPIIATDLLRVLAQLLDPTARPPIHVNDHLVADVVALAPAASPDALRAEDRAAWTAAARATLDAMHGNRGSTPTRLCDGTAERIVPSPSPRRDSRQVLERLRVADPERLLADLDAVAARHPRSSLPVCHKGELLLWLGRRAEARAALEQAIAIVPGTRWAYIGLTAIDLLDGEPEKALATSAAGVAVMCNTEGPAVLVHRAEANRLLGYPDAALPDLEKAVALHPTRVSAWLNLGLAHHTQSDRRAGDEVFQRLLVQAPGLLSDAARTIGVTLAGDAGYRVCAAEQALVLTRALDLLGGNRSSSCMSYHTPEGSLRFVPAMSPHAEPLHARDGVDLGRAASLFRKAAALVPRAGRQLAEADPPIARRGEVLTEAEVAHFVEHGHVVVRGCFDRALADRWRAHSIERFAEARACREGVIRLRGRRLWLLWEWLPRLWGAACDLLGDRRRVQTITVSDHFLIRDGNQPLERSEPPERLGDWHIDAPQTARLDDLRHGLTCIALLSDLGPSDGPTLLLPESLPMVARALAGPEPLDMDDPSNALAMARRCTNVVRFTGSVGDVVLLHPLVLHRGSTNSSPEPRWIAKPNIFLHEPLRPRRREIEARSPVERAIARALDRPSAS